MTWRIEGAAGRLALVAGVLAASLLTVGALARLDLLYLVVPLLLGVLAGLVLLRHPWTSFALLVASVPVQRLGAEGAGGLPATLTQLVFPVALGGLAVALLVSRRPLRGHVILMPAGALFAVMLAGAARAEDGGAALAELARWGVALAALALALQFIVGSSRARLAGFVLLLAAGGVFEATLGVVQSAIGFGPFELASGLARAYGTFGKPNPYAGYLLMTLFPALWLGVWYLGDTGRRLRVYAAVRHLGMVGSRVERRDLYLGALMAAALLASTAIIFGGVVASLSRGAWLGAAAGLVVTALLHGRTTRLATLIGGAGLAAVLVGGQAGLVPENYRERVTESASQIRPFDASNIPVTDENFAAVERMAHWQAGWRMFDAQRVLGIGIGNFDARFEDFAVREEFRISQGHAHNYYIHTLAETGLAGLVAYLTALGLVVALAARVLTSRSANGTFSRALVLGAFGSIVAVSTHNLFENLHVLNLGIVISLLWALVIAGHERWRSKAGA